MIRITIPNDEFYLEEAGEFYYVQETTIEMEHSLSSVARWESKWKKPFLDTNGVFKDEQRTKTPEEFYDYLKCMTLTKGVPAIAYRALTPLQLEVITAYIKDEATATTFTDSGPKTDLGQKITAEIIYYWMTVFHIPFECDQWHLNRLLALIRVCSIKSNPNKKKRPKREVYEERRRLNEERLAKYNTRG